MTEQTQAKNSKPTLTIFANYRIEDEERFLRLKDSFLSFKDINPEKWVINVRGKYKLDVLFFLHDHLGDKLFPHVLESRKGWFYDTRSFLNEIDTDFVLYWIEDHINMADVSKYAGILHDMKKNNVDVLQYSNYWAPCINQRLKGLQVTSTDNLDIYYLDKHANELCVKNVGSYYIISGPSICSREMFRKLVQANDPLLKRWPKDTPFDFEKRNTDTRWLPFTGAYPKYELFAVIDVSHFEGYQNLQERGLYPKRVLRESLSPISIKKQNPLVSYLKPFFPQAIKVFLKRVIYTLS